VERFTAGRNARGSPHRADQQSFGREHRIARAQVIPLRAGRRRTLRRARVRRDNVHKSTNNSAKLPRIDYPAFMWKTTIERNVDLDNHVGITNPPSSLS
jgi:hypothetical protein